MRSILTLALSVAVVLPFAAAAQDASPRAPMVRGMMAFDTDGDGVVTKAEMMAQTDRQFARLDADGNGTITATEQQAGRARMAARRGAGAGSAMPSAPSAASPATSVADGQGGVTREAFRQRAEQRFARTDANSDGRLEASEMGGRGAKRGRAGRGGAAQPIMAAPAPATANAPAPAPAPR